MQWQKWNKLKSRAGTPGKSQAHPYLQGWGVLGAGPQRATGGGGKGEKQHSWGATDELLGHSQVSFPYEVGGAEA